MSSVGQLGGFVLQKQIEPAIVKRLGGFVLVAETHLPENTPVLEALESMILSKATYEIGQGELVIGEPVAVELFNRNTRIEVTWPTGIEGSVYFYYNRVGVGQLKLPVGFLLDNESSSHQIIPRVVQATGTVLSEDDFEDLPFSNGITLRAKASSYWFIPGSQIIIGGTEGA